MSTMDVSEVIESMITGTYVVTRSVAATVDPLTGMTVAGATSVLSVDACVQPANGRDLQRLPEGLRFSEVRAVWALTQLLTAGAAQDPDTISIDGFEWQVEKVLDRSPDGNYCKALVRKVGG